jgi:hypothetical protein
MCKTKPNLFSTKLFRYKIILDGAVGNVFVRIHIFSENGKTFGKIFTLQGLCNNWPIFKSLPSQGIERTINVLYH